MLNSSNIEDPYFQRILDAWKLSEVNPYKWLNDLNLWDAWKWGAENPYNGQSDLWPEIPSLCRFLAKVPQIAVESWSTLHPYGGLSEFVLSDAYQLMLREYEAERLRWSDFGFSVTGAKRVRYLDMAVGLMKAGYSQTIAHKLAMQPPADGNDVTGDISLHAISLGATEE